MQTRGPQVILSTQKTAAKVASSTLDADASVMEIKG